MNESARGPLAAFALYVLPPTWVAGKPKLSNHTDVAWEGLGLRDVPITALRNGFVIFEFDESADYAGGAVPAYTLPEDRKIPLEVTKAKRERDDLGYRRFIYMNAFLLALYSGFSTVQKTAKPFLRAWGSATYRSRPLGTALSSSSSTSPPTTPGALCQRTRFPRIERYRWRSRRLNGNATTWGIGDSST